MKSKKKSPLKLAYKASSEESIFPLPVVIEEPSIGAKIHVPTAAKKSSFDQRNHPMYEPDDYDMERFRNGISLANSSSLDIQSSSSDESSKESDGSNSVAECTTNPTQLFLRINYRLWDMATSIIEENPAQVKTWVVSKNSSGEIKWKNLPIHNACEQSPQPPVSLVEALIKAYPKGVRRRNFEGNLPLHIACGNEALISSGEDGEAIIAALVESYPDSLTLADDEGRLPLQILNDPKMANSIKNKLNGEQKAVIPKKNINEDSATNTITELRSPPNPDRSTGIDLASELNRRSMMLPGINDDDSMRAKPEEDTTEIEELGDTKTSAFAPVIMKQAEKTSNTDPSSSKVAAILTPKQNMPPLQNNSASSSRNILGIEHSKAVREIILLRQQASRLTGENLQARTLLEEKAAMIKRLQNAVDKERGFCRDKVRELETRITSMNDSLTSYEHKIKLKEKAEETLAQTISSLESNLAGRKAEATTIREALKTETSSKATIESELGTTTRKVEQLCRDLERKHNDFEDLMKRYEESCKETLTVKQAYVTVERRVQEASHAISEKEVQLRAITESKALSEKRIQKLEQIIVSLRSKNTTLKDVVRKNNDSFSENTSMLEMSLNKHSKEKDGLREEIAKMLKRVEVRDQTIQTLKEEKQKLQKDLDNTRDKSSETSEHATQALSTLQQENARLKGDIETLTSSLNQSRKENESKASNLLKLANDADAVLDKLEKERKEVFQLKTENGGLQERIDAVVSENDANKSDIGRLKDENHTYKTKLEALNEEKVENEEKIRELTETAERAKSDELKNQHLHQEHALKLKQKTEECNHFKEAISKLHSNFEAQSKEINDLNETKIGQCTRIEELEEVMKSLKDANSSLTEKWEKIKKVDKQNEQEKEKLRAQVSDLEREKENLRSDNNKLLVETEKAMKAAKLQNHQLRQEHTKKIENMTKECDQFKVTIKKLEDKNKEQSNEIKELENRKSAQATKIKDLQESVSSLQKKIKELAEECDQLKNTVRILEDTNNEQSNKISNLGETKLAQADKISKLEGSVRSLQADNNSLSEKCEETKRALETSDTVKNKLFQRISEYDNTLKKIETENLEPREVDPNAIQENSLPNSEELISSKSVHMKLSTLRKDLHVFNNGTVGTLTNVPLRLREIVKKIDALKEGATLDKSSSSLLVDQLIEKIEKQEDESADNSNNSALSEIVSKENVNSLAETVKAALDTNESLLSDLLLIQTDLNGLSFSVGSNNTTFEESITKFQDQLSILEKELSLYDVAEVRKSSSQMEGGKYSPTDLVQQLRPELQHSESKTKEKEDLNKSFQKEVTRLLGEKTSMQENLRQLRDLNSSNEAKIEVLEQVKANLVKQVAEASNLIENITSKLNLTFKHHGDNDDSTNPVMQVKSEDGRANQANMDCLVKNTLLLEDRISKVAKANTLMTTQVENLRKDIHSKNERIEGLELVIKTLEIDLDGQKKLQKSSSDDKDELAKILEEYDSQSTNNYGEVIGNFKESRSQRLAGLLEKNCKEIMDLEEQVAKYDIKTCAYKTMIGQMQSTTETLKRENIFLKAAGKEQEYHARQNEQKLRKENSSLKLIIEKLMSHTEQLRSKIGELKDRQVKLQQTKDLLVDDATEDDLVFELWKLSATMSEDDDASDYFKELGESATGSSDKR